MIQKAVRRILVTGFTPFGGEDTNPSWELVKQLPDTIGGYRIEKLRVPTEFGKAIEVAAKAMDKLQPQVVLCFGQAGGRSRMSVERVAINVDDARIPDNAGRQVIDEPIRNGAPAAYFCSVPVKAMVAGMTRAGAPAEVSNSAGTFVCNHLIYGVLHHIATQGYAMRAGFIHVPFMESQILARQDTAGMSLDTMIAGAKAAIMAAVRNKTDLKLVGGTLD
ncbi:MAG: pyroglutamyl-peptidase I [Betaproteobacteria bacterium]